ncbi:ATP-binding protein [Streptomyces lonarensis]|uniref:ATP-binding protein n=1 Tax=Streptomyces lonarensis TaxID=700599 RepID=UPI0028B0EA13|nr:ATP-binding protein [Streptomyces lonarensis]
MQDAEPLGDRELHGGALLALLGGLLVWSLCWNGYIRIWLWPLEWVTTDGWSGTRTYASLTYLYYVLFGALLAYLFGRLGNWARVWRRHRSTALRLLRAAPDAPPLPRSVTARAGAALVLGAWAWGLSFGGVWQFWLEPLYALVPDGWWETGDSTAYVVAYNVHYLLWTALLLGAAAVAGDWHGALRRLRAGAVVAAGADAEDLARWQQLRDGGADEAADHLTAELYAGSLSDLDYVRIDNAWQAVRARPTELAAFTGTVLQHGPGAFTHPSGARDLTVRTARHDLLTRQVFIGEALDDDRNPYSHRAVGVALDPAVLGTSLLAVGPPGSGKTGRVVRPVTESLCLQALAGRAAVVAVGGTSAALGPDDAFDVVVRVGGPAGGHRLDLYGGIEDTDEAATLLAEVLTAGTRADAGEAAAVLAQLVGPYRSAYGGLPDVPELRALLDGAPGLMTSLGEDLEHAGAWDQLRELAARARQAERPDDVGRLLADRLAVLDRCGFSAAPGDTTGRRVRPFSLAAALEHPLRVRVDLPAAGHAEAARIISRLLLAQFTAAATARRDRSLFACLVIDDATAAFTAATVRGLTHLRPANAGAVLSLRTLDEVPERLRAGLLGAVGCRMALSGITTWDGEQFARAWGTEWTEDRDVSSSPDRHGGVLRRGVRGVRKLFTGRAATTETVTVRRVERERWSASELAHRLPPRHAVLSLSTVAGETGPPVLVRLGS